MGNCMDKTSEFPKQEQPRNNRRVKVVVRKEELEWVLSQVKLRQGRTTSLEDVLEELERCRGKAAAKASVSATTWKPSLEVITESPELHEVMDKS
ncbi:PREDICTED: uncharacterized protein LOC109164773 [Ipomoea nil]|uniref:uncharacterized protein LOC109164773 n=1 Tax=Ipomoea nil TaxID=35883 RepID=UPI000901B9D5|nr:PREDICTED: uncharacterized protein LOC109164773 [Ipomoea nil]